VPETIVQADTIITTDGDTRNVLDIGGGSVAWGDITGTLITQADLYAALLQFSGLSKITVGTVQPPAPSAGDLWIDTN
jgi:hypothetical protein